MTEEQLFETWWKRLRRDINVEQEPHRAADRIARRRRRLAGENETLADRFLERTLDRLLIEQKAYGAALFLLDALADPLVLDAYARRLRDLPEMTRPDNEAHLADLMRIMAAAGGTRPLGVVRGYLLSRPVSPWWNTVPWSLWPKHRRLFGRAWRRYFLEHDPEEWDTPGTLGPFLAEPKAIAVVRELLKDESPARWRRLRDALRASARSERWLDEEQREALARAVS